MYEHRVVHAKLIVEGAMRAAGRKVGWAASEASVTLKLDLRRTGGDR